MRFGVKSRPGYVATALLIWFALGVIFPAISLAQPNFSIDPFRQKWERADKAVAEGTANPARSWLWGPEAFNPPTGQTEPYAESPGGSRQVQYFDKARMELNNPATGLVTNGLLVRELISGKLATGDTAFIQRNPASDIPIAGDATNNNGPTYSSFAGVASLNNDKPSAPRIGAPVAETIDRDGRVGTAPELGSLAKYAYYDNTLKHNIADVFWYFMNQHGNVFQNGQYKLDQPVLGEHPTVPWLDAVGWPLSEPYWAKVTVAGQVKDVLIQAFERRVLTYTPSNPPAFQVEMGNVGQHYYKWRYSSKYDIPSQVIPQFMTGVNLAGAEFTPNAIPGTYGVDYQYPTQAEVDYFMSKGLKTFRLPFLWERLQPGKFGAFDQGQFNLLDGFVSYVTGKGATVILDPHNYARYYGQLIGSKDVPVEVFADLWSRLAGQYKDNPRVIFGLMNEPTNIQTQVWVAGTNSAIRAIRATGAKNMILVAGSSADHAYSWSQKWNGTAYGGQMLGISDPANNYAFELHQYLDVDASGTFEKCVSGNIGSQRLQDFTQWLRQNHKRGFLGEFGSASNPTCHAALDDMLNYVEQNGDVWRGWTYWAAGPLWQNYLYSLEPLNGTDRPQMAILEKHLNGPAIPVPPAGPGNPSQPVPPVQAPVQQPVSGSSFGVKYEAPGHWDTGYNISVTLSNTGSSPVKGWSVSWQLSYGETLTTSWNADCKIAGSIITCSSMSYNDELGANGGSQNFGAQFSTTGGKYSQPSSFTVNGVSVKS
ncbi:MAG TPA: cellulase family glycosylhydrolase [Chloroflexia bacterium]|nr:cellulase family glycosylhydrolase [Chloroflexia bacterium]